MPSLSPIGIARPYTALAMAVASGCIAPPAAVPRMQSAAEAVRSPLHGRWEGEIAAPRRPLVLLVDFDSLHARFSTTGSTTFGVHDAGNDGADLTFTIHAGRDTIPVRVNTAAGMLAGTVTLGGESYALTLRQLPVLPAPRSREEGWRQDLDVTVSRFLRYDRSFTPAARTAFEQRLAQLRDSAAALSDDELVVSLARAVALSDNAHTRLYVVRNRTEVRRMPFRVWLFDDGWYVVRADDGHRALLGCRLERVGGTDVGAAVERLRGIKAGNDSWQRYMATYMLTSAEILRGTQLAASSDSVHYGFSCNGRRTARTVDPLPLRRTDGSVEAWWDLAPAARRNADVPHSAVPAGDVPLYLRMPDAHYSFERRPSGILYFQYNRAQNTPGGPPLSAFGEELLAAAGDPDVRALVVDLRFNTGGNLGIATPLMQSLQNRFAGRPVFVITSRATFSAGITHVVQWKEWGATIVGEPAGDDLDTWSEGGNIVLPNSGLTVHYTNAFHSYSRVPRPELEPYFIDLNVDTIEPDIRVGLTWSDYVSGRDPALAAVERALAR